jgi:N-glycosylase/DNA lyase
MRLELDIEPLDLAKTLGCGQTFRWKPQQDGSWIGPLDGQLVTLSQSGSRLLMEAVPGGRGVRELVETHLRKGDEVKKVRMALSKDPVLAPGLNRFSGLRIVKMEEWECLCSFALATYANIPRISKMIETLANRFGKRIAGDVHSFPTIERMKRVPISELSRCGLGYRARYIHDMSKMLDSDRIDSLKRLGYEELREELMELPGVGDKVADCVALFGFGQLEAFPIDVWMMRALERLYGQTGSYTKLRAFAHARFGSCAGYAQEYLYYNERTRATKGGCAFSR